MKFIRILILLLAFCLLFAGCKNAESVQEPEEPEIQVTEPPFSHGGVHFSLPEDFTDYTKLPLGQNYEFLYANAHMGIYGLKDNSGGLDEEINSLEAFAAAQAERNGTEAVKKDTCWTFSYEDQTQNEPQMIICAIYESGDYYWSIFAYCPSDLFESNSEAMWGYITTPVFE